MLRIEINDPYPTSSEVYSHELNEGKILTIGFYDGNAGLDLTGTTVTATIVCNKALVAEDVSVSLSQSLTNAVDFNVCSTSDYTIRPGVMLVEFKISKNSKLMYPVVPMIINITPSIRNNAEVTPESYGTVSEILQEVAEARGTYNTLGARLDNTDDKFPVDTSNIKDNAVTTNKLAGSAVTTSKIYPNAVTENKIANGSVTTDKIAVHAVTSDRIGNEEVKTVNIKDGAVGESKIASGAVTSGKLGVGAVSSAKIDTNAVTENKITNNAVTYAKLSSELQGTIDGKADLTDLDELLRYSPYTINTASQLNISGYASEHGRYGLKLVGPAANSFGVESGTLAEMKVIGVGEVSAQNPYVRVITFPEIEGVKWYQEVTSIGLTFTAGNWIKEDNRPSKIIYFDVNECICNVYSAFPYQGPYTTAYSMVVPSSITTIPNSILTYLPNVTTIYVDNASTAVTLGSDVQTAVQNEDIVIYYKGEYNLADLLAKSQKSLNDRLTALENTVGTVNTALENAINGVSS